MAGKTKLLKAVIDTERFLAHGSITTSFTAIGTEFSYPMRRVRFFNQTDVVLQYSLDGTDVDFTLASGQVWDINVMGLKQSEYGLYFPAGTIVYVKYITGAAPTSGSAIVDAVYAV